MLDEAFDQDAWLTRVGYDGSRAPTLETLRTLIIAHSASIAYESIDVLLDRPPKLDLASLQEKMIAGGRGGYCFEQNMLFRGGLRSLGYKVTSLQARVVRGLEIGAPRPMFHMVLRVDLPEGPFLADVGFGNLAPTAPLKLLPFVEQASPHEVMRFIAMGEELTLQSKLGDRWEHIYRVVPLPRFDAEYEICNWFAGTHPQSPYLNNLIAALPGPNGTRLTLFNARFNVRYASGQVERRTLRDEAEYRSVLRDEFGIMLSDADLRTALAHIEQKALPLLRDGASIVLTSSTAGVSGTPALSVYSATKAAVRSFARNWILDLKDRHIRVNAVSPGVTETPGLDVLFGGGEQAKGTKGYLAGLIPAGRIGQPEEIAKAVLFLASNEASFINGVELFVDGGQVQI
jgi:N-hydroxyarylamine O-acetyltransferase